MVRSLPKPTSVEEAKANLRASVSSFDYLAPIRKHPLPIIAVGLVGGILFARAMKKRHGSMPNGLFELGVAFARKYLNA
jgi:hypothetical protein